MNENQSDLIPILLIFLGGLKYGKEPKLKIF
jgi:hypothetical protein